MSSTALEPCSSSTTDWIINMFEAEQKSAVFGSLAGYLNTATFADVSLACRNQVLRAHKVVLAASSKFFSDLFKHNPAINVVDLDRELSPNGLDLTYEDVQLIIGILYCVGTVEISPERIESLLLIAQVLGIPTLIHLLKRIKRSLSATPDPSYSQSFTVKPGSTFQSFDDHQESLQKQRSSSSVSFFSLASPRCSTTSFANRSNNTNVLESLDPSFLQQLNNLHQIDDIENAFMPHLQNNTTSHSFVDSIEAYDESSIKSSNSLPFDSSGFGKLLPESNGDLSSRSVPLLPDRNLMSVDNVSEPLTPLDRHDQPSKPLSPPALDNKDREEAPKEKNESLILEDGRIQAPKEKNKSTDDEFENVTLASPKSKNQSTLLEEAPRIKNPPELLPSDDDQFDKVESLSQNVELESTEKEIEESESDEIRVNLDSIASNGKSIRLSIPGASNGSVTLNFTAEALTEMRNSFMMNKSSSVSPFDKINDEVSSSTQPESGDSPILAGSSRRSVDGVSALKRRRKKEKKGSNKLDDKKNKSVYKCSLCNQSFSSQKAFEKHGNFHIEQSSCTCIECGKTFRKRWALEQHLAIDHRSAESSNDHQASCEDCGKTFGWKRNLLAHVLLHHQKEIRYRCRYCPLTFLKKKLYLNHHTNKHIDKPPTWCQLCFKVFENSKVLEDHQCDGLENTGERVICHKPHPESNKKTFSFSNLKDVESHINEFHPDEKIDCQMKSSCPVCHKKFLLKRYLFIHVRHFHDEETNKLSEETNNKLTCRVCKKVFSFEMDRKNHELVHNNKKFNCSECDKSYYWKKALLNHVQSSHRHGDQKPEYKCEVCGKKLSNKYKLKYHMTVHSDVKLFMCNICGIKFKAQDNLLRHKKKHHKTPIIKPSNPPLEEEEVLSTTTLNSLSSSIAENEKS